MTVTQTDFLFYFCVRALAFFFSVYTYMKVNAAFSMLACVYVYKCRSLVFFLLMIVYLLGLFYFFAEGANQGSAREGVATEAGH